MKNLIGSSFLAGLFISIGCIVNLSVGGIPGAVLFSLGLLSVVCYRLKLYTGTAGFINLRSRKDCGNLALIVIWNIVACAILAFMVSYSLPDLSSSTIISKMINLGPIRCGINAILCGVLMTLAVKFGRERNWLPLLWAVPVFILSGFRHSIADGFYISLFGWTPGLLLIWIAEVFGNFIGCNIVRLLCPEKT
jgi:formate/nitrite transporter FocA (FNT family)